MARTGVGRAQGLNFLNRGGLCYTDGVFPMATDDRQVMTREVQDEPCQRLTNKSKC